MKKLIFALLLFACGAASGRGSGPVFTPADSPEIRFTAAPQRAPGERCRSTGAAATSRSDSRARAAPCGPRTRAATTTTYSSTAGTPASPPPPGADSTVVLAEGLERGPHTILVQKRTEGEQGRTTLRGVETDGALLPLPAPRTRHIEFIGDSHTCGYGTEGKSVEEPFTPETENCDLAWGCVIARYFDAEYTLIAHSGQGIVRNWGDEKEVSDCTMRERMLRTFDMDPASRWDFRGCTPDIVVIKLGSNDFSTDVTPSEQAFNASYAQALDQLRAAYGEVPVLCVAPSDNTVILRYLENFLRERQDAHLHLTAMLPGITDWDRDMGANYHPNHRGHRKMAMAVIPYIATITGWEMPDRNVE